MTIEVTAKDKCHWCADQKTCTLPENWERRPLIDEDCAYFMDDHERFLRFVEMVFSTNNRDVSRDIVAEALCRALQGPGELNKYMAHIEYDVEERRDMVLGR